MWDLWDKTKPQQEPAMNSKYETVIGLEVHVQLTTAT
jgi:hypothetical protein